MHDGAMSIGVEERTRDEICDDRSGKVTMSANEDPPDLSALFAAIQQAHVAIRPHVPVTPLALSVALSGRFDSTVLLKNEHLQPTGSFKYRGATNRVRSLSEEQRQRGVITASTGNHGLAVAQAGMLAGVGVTVYVARSAAAAKRAAIAALGATLVVVEGPTIEAEVTARRDAAAQGKVFISPYNDAVIVAGQGTAGVELAEQEPDLDAVFVAVGGGGLIGGIGAALRRLAPKAEIVGVWPENTPAMLRSLEAGRIVDTPDLPTLSDGTAGAVEPGSITFPLCESVIDRYVTVSEQEIAAAMRLVAETDHWMVEGSAGAALAGLVRAQADFRGRKVAVVLCGRNIAVDDYINALAMA